MTNSAKYFKSSPFAIVPTLDATKIWASTERSLTEVRRMLHRIRGDASSIDMVWATFGSGKTHALYYLAREIKENAGEAGGLVCVYFELTEGVKGFMDFYGSFAAAADWPKIVPLLAALPSATNVLAQDARRVANLFMNGTTADQEIALRWLRGEKVHLNELRRAANVARRIETEADAVDMLSLISTAALNRGGKLVLLVDEFQRAANISGRARSSLMSFVRTLFNRNGRGLSIVFAVTCGLRDNALALIPDELRTLMGSRPGLSLPELSVDEAMTFCTRRLAAFRPEGYNGDEAGPFGEGVISALVHQVNKDPDQRLIPRTLIQGLGSLMEELEIREFAGLTSSDVETVLLGGIER